MMVIVSDSDYNCNFDLHELQPVPSSFLSTAW